MGKRKRIRPIRSTVLVREVFVAARPIIESNRACDDASKFHGQPSQLWNSRGCRPQKPAIAPAKDSSKPLIYIQFLVNSHKSSHAPKNSQGRRGIHSFKLLSRPPALYNVASYPIESNFELRCPVTQAIATQQYSGVYCRACGEPISLPVRAERAVATRP